jgi:hypothetical protein
MITYSYKVTKIQCIVKDDLLDYVKFVNYDMIGEENGVSTYVNMYACLPNVEVDPNFIPYSQTTEQDVIDWSNAAVGEDYINQMKSVLSDKLIEINTSQLPYDKPLIWA